MAAGFKTAQVAAADIPASQTDFPVYVDLSRLGITTLAEAQSVRVYADSAKTTEWAREIVSATEMHVKVPSLTSTTSIYVDWDGVRADYAVTDTYGRNAVWSDYEALYHFETITTDYTGNSYTLTNVGTVGNTAGVLGQGIDLGTANSSKALYSTGFPFPSFGTSLTISFLVRMNTEISTSAQNFFSAERSNGSTRDFYHFQYEYNGGTRRLSFSSYRNPNVITTYNVTLGTSNWHKITYTWTSSDSTSRIYLDGALVASNLDNGAQLTTGTSYVRTTIGRYTDNGNPALQYANSDFDEFRFLPSAVSADWETTEYNNQSDEAGFWGTWTTAGGGSTPTRMLMGIGS